MTDSCADCGAPSRIRLSNVPVCDRCHNRRVAKRTGYPDLPDPPPPEVVVGPDGRHHSIRYRLLRGPAGVEAWAGEDADPGYRFEIVGTHDDDPVAVAAAMQDRVRRELGRLYIETEDGRPHVADRELAGRIEEDEDEDEGWLDVPRVVVDGCALSWEELGRLVMPFVGWEFRIRFGEETVYNEEIERNTADNVIPLHNVTEGLELDDEDEAFLEQWDEAERQGVELLREALRDHVGRPPPTEALATAARRIREGIATNTWPFEWIARGTGVSADAIPHDDPELVVRCLAGLVALEDETGLGSEADASIMTIEHADWLGSAVMFARAGAGALADAAAFVKAIGDCPEVEGDVDGDDDELLEHSFEILLPALQAIGIVDQRERLTELGAWVLPRAVALAWNGDFDAGD